MLELVDMLSCKVGMKIKYPFLDTMQSVLIHMSLQLTFQSNFGDPCHHYDNHFIFCRHIVLDNTCTNIKVTIQNRQPKFKTILTHASMDNQTSMLVCNISNHLGVISMHRALGC